MTSKTHLAFASTAVGVTSVIEIPTPSPGPGEVMVNVAYSAVIPLDTYMTDYGRLIHGEYPVVLGFNLSGVVEAVGSGVDGLQTGYKVCAFATIPDDFITAFYTLFDCLELPPPMFTISALTSHAETPILVYGAGATSGQYAVQLLSLAGYRRDCNRSLGAAHDMAKKILLAAGESIQFVLDCISAEGMLKSISSIVNSNGIVAMLLPVTEGSRHIAGKDVNPFPDSVKLVGAKTLAQNEYLRDNLMPNILPRLLEEDIIQPNRVCLFDQGSFQDRCQGALDVVRNGQVNGEKNLVKVASM
ncbi:hypothetical protein DEU56DRAFT_868136 [Suillus clintonianus]|uniref:uncharacterized protein n=1 Tax=Suillus clintonianus TaxID=1904413 RepID=UPI001B87FA38|nr:uncharacterized protein DEU56DRAFT_868136 [Suillus clintonianus]KAG2155751.1 hypothetical protein DEU56DRAFT_868136 [Suillus clintonianus]